MFETGMRTAKALRTDFDIRMKYAHLVLEHLSDTFLDYGICKLCQGIIDMMEGKPEKAIEYRDKYFNTNRITTNKNT